MFAVRHGAPRVQRAVWLNFVWALLVASCEHPATQPLPTANLVFRVQPSNTFAGATLTPPIQVAAEDVNGHTVTSFAGNVTIAVGTNPGGGTLSGTRTVAASNGIATFPDLSIDAGGNGYTFVASATGLGAATSTSFNAVHLSNCLTDCWTIKAPMLTVRSDFSVGAVNGMLYTVGGSIRGPSPRNPAMATVEAYDPTTNGWTTKAPMLEARSGAGVGVVNGVLYAVGGVPAYQVHPLPTGTVQAYDPVTNTWTTRQPMSNPRGSFGVGVVNGILYAVGGILPIAPGGSTNVVISAAEAYDPLTNTWTAKAPMPTPRFGVAVGVVNGLLYAVGGHGPDFGDPLTVVEAYDPISNTWVSKASLPTARSGLDVGVVNAVIYAVGGGASSTTGTSIVSTVEAYDPTTNTWTTKAPMPTARRFLRIGVLNGVLYAIGGQYAIPGATEDTGANEAYHP
jgi:N-acetylneuraminic acid mutarotase